MEQYPQTSGEYKIGDNTYLDCCHQFRENLSREKTVVNEIYDKQELHERIEGFL